MKKLNKGSFEKAKNWIKENGRPLEKARLEFTFGDADVEKVIDALKTFQNKTVALVMQWSLI